VVADVAVQQKGKQSQTFSALSYVNFQPGRTC
jgi:hypothetical protein